MSLPIPPAANPCCWYLALSTTNSKARICSDAAGIKNCPAIPNPEPQTVHEIDTDADTRPSKARNLSHPSKPAPRTTNAPFYRAGKGGSLLVPRNSWSVNAISGLAKSK
jgi:hypothetical protein